MGFHLKAELWSSNSPHGAPGRGSANEADVVSTGRPWLRSQWVQNAVGTVVGGLVLAALYKAWGMLSGTLPRVSIEPLWFAWLILFMAAFTMVTVFRAGWAALRPQTDGDSEIHSGQSGDVEIDLRSTSPIVAANPGRIPQLGLTLRITNFTACDLTVTNVSATVAFSQVTVEMTIKRSVELPAFSTVQDITLRQVLEAPLVTAISDFFDRTDDHSMAVYVSVEADFRCGNETFKRRPPTFQRYLPEILSIKQWNL